MKIILLTLSIFTLSTIHAADSSSGCGLGWAVLKKNSLVSSFTRVFVNATFSNTIGMTFGTSGCAQHSIVKNESKIIHFAEMNHYQIQKEAAIGNGAYLVAISDLIGCSSANDFSYAMKKDFDKIYPSNATTPKQALTNIFKNIQKSQTLSKNCRLI